MNDWKWIPEDSSRPGALRYEPGNWGDLLKNAWLAIVVARLCDAPGGERLVLLDPFAGRPSYPLASATRRRLASIPDDSLRERIAGAPPDRFPSSASVALAEARRHGVAATLGAFDVEAEFREAWRSVDGVEVLDVESGDDALRLERAFESDLILIDPYDLFDNWRRRIDSAVELARGRAILLYLHDKSPRGPGHAEQYAALTRAVDSGLDSSPARSSIARSSIARGRLPTDAVDPRAYHEIVLLGPSELVETLREDLRGATRVIERAFEIAS